MARCPTRSGLRSDGQASTQSLVRLCSPLLRAWLLTWRPLYHERSGVDMRALVRSAIIADPTLNGLGITGSSSFAVDVDTPQVRPFLQLRWGTNVPGLDTVT